MRALDVATAVPWAIQPDALRAMLAIAAREDIPREVVAAAMTGGSPEAVAARLGKPLENTRTVTTRDGVATIPISGPIFRHANLFSEISGAVTTGQIATDLTAALDDPSVSAILLEIDSPGGEIAGISELAGMVRDTNAQKPVTAYIDHLGASAAYWLASAAGRIVAAPTAMLGSIGVVMVLDDPAKTDSTDIEFVSSQSPKKRPDLTTKGGQAQVQATVDDLADVFIADVATYRGVSIDTVASDFGEGGVFVGQHAVDAGLADAVGSYEETLRSLAEQTTTAPALPAPTPLRPDGPRRKIAMGINTLWSKFIAGLDPADVLAMTAGASADQEAAIMTANLTPPQSPAPAPAASSVDGGELARARADAQAARSEALAARAEAERYRMERIQAEAIGFVTQAIASEKAFPSERVAIIAFYVQAATDDAKMGDGANRVGLLSALYTARPASALTREQLNPAALQILRQHEPQPKGEQAPTKSEVDDLIGLTAFGQAHLAGSNGSSLKH